MDNIKHGKLSAFDLSDTDVICCQVPDEITKTELHELAVNIQKAIDNTNIRVMIAPMGLRFDKLTPHSDLFYSQGPWLYL